MRTKLYSAVEEIMKGIPVVQEARKKYKKLDVKGVENGYYWFVALEDSTLSFQTEEEAIQFYYSINCCGFLHKLNKPMQWNPLGYRRRGMKSDINGQSTCPKGKAQWEKFLNLEGEEKYQYDYHAMDGDFFTGVFISLKMAQIKRDQWLEKKGELNGH